MNIISLVILFLVMLVFFTILFISLNIILTNKMNSPSSKSESTSEGINVEVQYVNESESEPIDYVQVDNKLLTEDQSCNKATQIRQEIINNNDLNENGERLDGKELMDYSENDDVYGSCIADGLEPSVHLACKKYAKCTEHPDLKSGCYVQSNDGYTYGCPAKCCNFVALTEESSTEESS